MPTTTTTSADLAQATLLASKTGWHLIELDSGGHWTHAWTRQSSDPAHPHNVAVIWARFSPSGRLTVLEGIDPVAGVRLAPSRFKTTRLSHWLTEGLA
jgi:hypothetical protein